MKKKIGSWLSILFVGVITFSLGSCKKKTDDLAPNEEKKEEENVPKGKLLMHLHNYVEDAEVQFYNVTYTTSSESRKIKLSMGQLYLSNIQLVRLDGSFYTVPGTIILKEQGMESYEIADVPVGNYKTVRFNIGLDANINKKTPSAEASDPLNKPSMWYSNTWQPEGYVFVNAQGKIDTTADASGTEDEMQPFSYRIGTNANLMTRVMPEKRFAVSQNYANYIHMKVDYSKLFSGIPIHNPAYLSVNSSVDNSSPMAAAIVLNIPSMFDYHD